MIRSDHLLSCRGADFFVGLWHTLSCSGKRLHGGFSLWFWKSTMEGHTIYSSCMDCIVLLEKGLPPAGQTTCFCRELCRRGCEVDTSGSISSGIEAKKMMQIKGQLPEAPRKVGKHCK